MGAINRHYEGFREQKRVEEGEEEDFEGDEDLGDDDEEYDEESGEDWDSDEE